MSCYKVQKCASVPGSPNLGIHGLMVEHLLRLKTSLENVVKNVSPVFGMGSDRSVVHVLDVAADAPILLRLLL